MKCQFFSKFLKFQKMISYFFKTIKTTFVYISKYKCIADYAQQEQNISN